ncbi:hypothetical protein MLD38_004022 [Melastoma candidum]|uniref:Uncharacterized protein n=1 Tax=Melastoma candidum TaxID=119954 RepID=A0ACB9S437_9MYRT|nr:hypothetical protein MLD38_004022 [Melastoma candidum]
MASHKNYRFFDVDAGVYPAATRHDHPALEFNESDIYDSSAPSSLNRPRKPVAKRAEDPRREQIRCKVTSPSSLPVNIPDWSKILQGEEYRRKGGGDEDYLDDDDDEGDGEGRDWIPPHEFLARARIGSSFSVHEGAGRTLKGRDLRRVRNAIWAKTGFQD